MKKIIEKSFNQLKSNFLELILITIMTGVITLGLNGASAFSENILTVNLINIVSVIISVITVKVYLKIASGADRKNIFEGILKNIVLDIFKVIGIGLIVAIIVAVPSMAGILVLVTGLFMGEHLTLSLIFFILCIVFIICFVCLYLAFVQYTILDEELEDLSYMKRISLGIKLTKGNKFMLIKYYAISLLLMILGVMTLFVGFLVITPLINLMLVNIYVNSRDKYLYEKLECDNLDIQINNNVYEQSESNYFDSNIDIH